MNVHGSDIHIPCVFCFSTEKIFHKSIGDIFSLLLTV